MSLVTAVISSPNKINEGSPKPGKGWIRSSLPPNDFNCGLFRLEIEFCCRPNALKKVFRHVNQTVRIQIAKLVKTGSNRRREERLALIHLTKLPIKIRFHARVAAA